RSTPADPRSGGTHPRHDLWRSSRRFRVVRACRFGCAKATNSHDAPAFDASTHQSRITNRERVASRRRGLPEGAQQLRGGELTALAGATVPQLDDAVRCAAAGDDDRRHAEELRVAEL